MSLALLQGEPYFNFINSLKSEETKGKYRTTFLNFISHYQKSLDDLLSLTTKDIEQMIINYITNMNARGLSHGYINLVMCAILHFFDMNDRLLNKRKIARFLGEHKRMNKDRAYSDAEIKLLADSGEFRFKALILLLASTGIRLGSVPSLLVRHCRKKGDIYKITVYENSKEEYFVFTTVEATNALDAYFQYRKRASEIISEDSPLFRNDFNINSIASVRKNSRPISLDTLKNILYARLIKVGLIEKPEKVKGSNHTGTRHQVPLSHGFRKFWMNQAVKAKINPEIREMLLGHKIGIASSYYRPTEDEMQAEIEKAADLLTINEENKLRREVKMLTIEKSKVDLALSEIAEMKKQIGLV
jgi:integrase